MADATGMSGELTWSVKASLLEYVRGMADGEIHLHGVRWTPAGFAFPALDEATDPDEQRFSGTVALTGHGGMMRIVIRDPSLVRRGTWWVLTIADVDEPSGRLDFARMPEMVASGPGVLRARGTVLTASGADLFFGPYRDGTQLDDPVVVLA